MDSGYLYASGFGDAEHVALKDAKKQLALNLISVIEVNEKSSIVKTSHGVDSSFLRIHPYIHFQLKSLTWKF